MLRPLQRPNIVYIPGWSLFAIKNVFAIFKSLTPNVVHFGLKTHGKSSQTNMFYF